MNPITRNLFLAQTSFTWRKLTYEVTPFCALVFVLLTVISAQTQGGQTELSTVQRFDVMSSKLDHMRRSLNSAISAIPEDKSKTANVDDPVVRLKGLEKEVSSVMSDV